MVVPAAILREKRALPPPMMPAMADTATGLQIAGLRTTKARIGSVPAKDAFIWGQSTPVKRTGMLTMPVMGLMVPDETAWAENLLNQVRIRHRERPVNTGHYIQQCLPTSGAARPLCCLVLPSVPGTSFQSRCR